MVYFSSAAFIVCFILRTAVARDEHQFLYPHTDRHANTTLERNLQCNAAITRFELVNALKDSIISKLPDVIDYDNEAFAAGMNIIAKTRSCSRKETVRSVKLEFDDPRVSFCSNQKKGTPFSVFGSTKSADGKDNYNAVLFPLGYKTVRATPYTKQGCKGDPPSKTLSKSFDVKGCIDGIEYYDADTNEMFTGNLANPPCNMNFQVKISDRCQYPVDFVLIVLTDVNGQVVARRTSRQVPYFLFGNLGTDMKPGFYHIVAYINGKQLSLDTSFTIGGTCTRQLPPTPAPTTIGVTPTPDPTIIGVTVSPTLVAAPACESISIESLLEVNDPIFNVGDINVLTLIYEKYQEAADAVSIPSVAVLLPAMICADSDDDVSSLGGAAGVTSCEKLDFLADTDVLAFGLEINDIGLCAAFNIETDTYALGQVGILPDLPIGSVVTLTLDAIGFSRTKKLSKLTLNEMWDGTKNLDGTTSQAKINVRGHLVIRGTGSFGFKLSTIVECTIGIDTSLVIDADYRGNGIANIFDDKSDTIDFAILVSGRATPVFKVTTFSGEIKEIDLGSLIRVDMDIYLVVDGSQTELQLAASIVVSLQGICDISPFLWIICEVFDGNSGLSGAVRAYGSESKFGVQFAVSGQFAFADEAFEIFAKEYFGWDLTGGVSFEAKFQLQVAGDDVLVCATITGTGIDEWCVAKCNSDDDCFNSMFCYLGLYCMDRIVDGTTCLLGTSCEQCLNGYEFWDGPFAWKCGTEPCWENGSVCDRRTSCTNCCEPARQAIGTQCGGGCWEDGTICSDLSVAAGGTCDLCCSPSDYWESKLFSACGQEPCWEDGRFCVPGITCTSCCNPARQAGGTQCGGGCWNDGTICLPGTTCNFCCNEAKQDAGTKCGGGCWNDGIVCGPGTTCDLCCNTARQAGGTQCGGGCWADGEACGPGTTCNFCCNPARQAAGTKCGGGCWGRGEFCGIGTTCSNCCSGQAWSFCL